MRPGDRAWLALAAGVAVWEIAAPADELLSEACGRYVTAHPWLTRAVITAVAVHLVGLVPNRADPIHHLTRIRPRALTQPPRVSVRGLFCVSGHAAVRIQPTDRRVSAPIGHLGVTGGRHQ